MVMLVVYNNYIFVKFKIILRCSFHSQDISQLGVGAPPPAPQAFKWMISDRYQAELTALSYTVHCQWAPISVHCEK